LGYTTRGVIPTSKLYQQPGSELFLFNYYPWPITVSIFYFSINEFSLCHLLTAPITSKKLNNCSCLLSCARSTVIGRLRQESSKLWFEFHAFIQTTPKVIAQKVRKFERQRDEWRR
jgi:hypothetical protein